MTNTSDTSPDQSEEVPFKLDAKAFIDDNRDELEEALSKAALSYTGGTSDWVHLRLLLGDDTDSGSAVMEMGFDLEDYKVIESTVSIQVGEDDPVTVTVRAGLQLSEIFEAAEVALPEGYQIVDEDGDKWSVDDTIDTESDTYAFWLQPVDQAADDEETNGSSEES